MANDDFTAHDDELTPEASEHTPEDAAANPFYTEVPPTDLVIDNEIVFDDPLDALGGDEPEAPSASIAIGDEFLHDAMPADENVPTEENMEAVSHDSVTASSGAGGEVSLQADAPGQQDDLTAGDTADFIDEEPPVELIVEDALTPDDEVVDDGVATGTESVSTVDTPAEEAPFATEDNPESDPELTRAASLPEVIVPDTLASNEQWSPPEGVEIAVTDEDIVTPQAIIEGEVKSAFLAESPSPAPMPAAAPVVASPEPIAKEGAEEITATEFAAEEASLPTEPPAVASAIPVTPPARGDDSTWQEISRRRSLFHPVSEPAIASLEEVPTIEEAPADEATEVLPVEPLMEVDEATLHTTTIPVASVEEITTYQPGPHSGEIPLDVLSGREKDADEVTTTMMRRDLLATPPSVEADSATAWHQALHDSAPPLPAGDTPQKLDDAIFEGTTVVPVVPSRVGTHVLSLLLTMILFPVTWYFLADAGARMTLADGAPIASGQVSLWALLEFAIGIIGFMAIIALAVRSSLGAWVSGLLLTIAGVPWLLAPGAMLKLTQAGFDWISSLGTVGHNLAHHLQVSAYSGRLLMLGIALWAVGIVSHSVRRRGRAEEALRAEVERVNPAGAHLTWSARRRAAKEAARNEHANR